MRDASLVGFLTILCVTTKISCSLFIKGFYCIVLREECQRQCIISSQIPTTCDTYLVSGILTVIGVTTKISCVVFYHWVVIVFHVVVDSPCFSLCSVCCRFLDDRVLAMCWRGRSGGVQNMDYPSSLSFSSFLFTYHFCFPSFFIFHIFFRLQLIFTFVFYHSSIILLLFDFLLISFYL